MTFYRASNKAEGVFLSWGSGLQISLNGWMGQIDVDFTGAPVYTATADMFPSLLPG